MQSPLEVHAEFITAAIARGESNCWIAKNLPIPTTSYSVKRFRDRHELGYPSKQKGEVSIKGDDAELTSKPSRKLDDPDTMLRERGLDPSDWLIENLIVNEWDGPSKEQGTVTYYQCKLHLKRKKPLAQLVAPRTDGWKAPKPKKPARGKPQLTVVVGDQQAPFQDEGLHAAFCSWLQTVQPDYGITLGDTIDLPTISRHRLDPENTATVNECLQAGYDLLRGYREASPATRWTKLCGNHDERLRNILLDKPSVQPLYGIKRADSPEDAGGPVMTVPHLLRLDELEIDYADPEGPYDMGQVEINDRLAVRHGWIAKKGSGSSALATLEHLGYSCIVGHTHRQGIVYHTAHDIHGEPKVLTGVEAGCMCRVDQKKVNGKKFPGFTVLPDWQQGFVTVVTYPDSQFRVEPATYVNKTLLWRDERWRA
jgi:hypothetical protein